LKLLSDVRLVLNEQVSGGISVLQ